MDSATSPPNINNLYPYSRKGSSAQLSINSTHSSVIGREDYVSEQEQLHNGQTPPFHQGRTTAASPAIPNTPGQSQALSGLVCNVHRTTGKEPPPLVGATTTIIGDKLYVFGGRRASRSRPSLTSDIYELDLLLRHWTRLETRGDTPAPRYFHSVCALGDNKLVCYGGMSAEGTGGPSQNGPQEPQVTVMSDIHIYDTPTRTWMRVTSSEAPQCRYAHCAAILPSSAVFASADAPISAIHNNPSGNNPNAGSIGVEIDGAGGAEMIVVGGQDSENHYIEQISVFNLRSLKWTSTLPMSGRSCGAYRSVATPLTSMSASKIGAGPGRPDDDEVDSDDDMDDDVALSGAPMLIYTNYNFLDVKLELQVRLTDGTVLEKAMDGSVSPPGLRFPSGGVINNHFVVAGTFLTSSKQEFSLWALDLRTLVWARIDPGSTTFSQGSWNRGVLWNRKNAFVILGHRTRNLVEDYNNRRLNFSNMCVVQLEAFGLYDNPRRNAPTSNFISGSAPSASLSSNTETAIGGRPMSAAAELLGEHALASRELCDMEVVASDGTRIPASSRIVARRWGSVFNTLLKESTGTLESADTATLRAVGSSLLSRNSSITITPSLSSTATTLTPGANPSNEPADARALPPDTRPRMMYLPHVAPTVQAFLHYLYTSSLPAPSSPLSSPQVLCSMLQFAQPYKIDGLLEATLERLHETLDGRNAAAIFNATAMAAGGGQSVDFAPDGTSTSSGAGNGGAGGNAHPPRSQSLAGVEGLSLNGNSFSDGTSAITNGARGLRINTDIANGNASSQASNGSRSATTTRARAISTSGNQLSAGGILESDGEDDGEIPGSASTEHSLSSQLSMVSMQSSVYGGGRREEQRIWDGGSSAVIGLQKRGLRGLMEGRRARERGGAGGAGGGRGESQHGAGEARVGLGIA